MLPLACAAAFPAVAQSSASPTTTLQETVVTATRVAQPLTDVVADVTIIDREAIERSGASALADLLARVPGFSFSRNGGPGATTSLYLRGGETRFTAVFVDGVRVDSQSTGGATWNAIPLSRVERIEVVRGPAAAVYGSDAMAGVVQIFTREGELGLKPSLELGLGSLGTARVDAALSGAQGAVDYALGITRETSDGFNAKPADNPDADGYRSTAVSARLGWKVAPGHKIEASYLANDLKSQYDAFAPGNDDWSLHDLKTLGLGWQARWSDRYSTRVSVTESQDRYETTPSPYRTETTVRSYLWQNEWRQDGHLVTAALERREDALDNASTTPVQTERSQNALALGYGLRAGAHTVQLNLRHDDDSEFGGNSTGSAAYAYGFAPGWRATASAGTAFRAPTLFQRFSVYGSPLLRPETGRNLEVGVHYDHAGTRLGVVAFRNKVEDLINFGAAGPCISSFGCYENVGRAQYSGVSLEAATRLGLWSLRGSLALQTPKDLRTGNLLARRPRQLAQLGAETQAAGWDLGAELQLEGERYDDTANTRRLAGFGLLNISAGRDLGQDWRLNARVDNLGDKDYQTVSGYATPGRTVYVGLKWSPKH